MYPRLLFAPDLETSSDYSKIRVNKILEILINAKFEIGLLDAKEGVELVKKKYSDLIFFEDILDVNEKDWDIIFVQNSANLQRIGKKVLRKPIVFISNSDKKEDLFLNLPNLYEVIKMNSYSSLYTDMLNTGFIKFISIPVFKLYKPIVSTLEHEKHYKIVYFVDPDDQDLRVALAIIKAINVISYVLLTVVTTIENVNLLREVANNNISFVSPKTKSLKSFFLKHDVILASGELAIPAILSGRPVVIVGIKGLGGLVCSDNIDDFRRTCFSGRIGGSIYEDIPYQLLDYELRFALNLEDKECSSFINQNDYKDLRESYNTNWELQIVQTVNANVSLFNYIRIKKLTLKLIPKINHNVYFQLLRNGEKAAVLDKSNGRLFGVIGKTEYLILLECDGKQRIDEINEKAVDISMEDVIEFVLQLWKMKILILITP